MEDLFKEYGSIIISGFVACLILVGFMSNYAPIINDTKPMPVDVDVKDNSELSQKQKPILTAKSSVLDYNPNEEFDYHQYVKAYDANGNDISNLVKIYDPAHTGYEFGVNLKEKGEYTVTYICTYDGVSSYAQGSYIVE